MASGNVTESWSRNRCGGPFGCGWKREASRCVNQNTWPPVALQGDGRPKAAGSITPAVNAGQTHDIEGSAACSSHYGRVPNAPGRPEVAMSYGASFNMPE